MKNASTVAFVRANVLSVPFRNGFLSLFGRPWRAQPPKLPRKLRKRRTAYREELKRISWGGAGRLAAFVVAAVDGDGAGGEAAERRAGGDVVGVDRQMGPFADSVGGGAATVNLAEDGDDCG